MGSTSRFLFSMGAAASLFAAVPAAQAAPVTDFRTFRANQATVISGETANDPIVGSVADADANGLADNTGAGARIIGYFTPVTLANAGDMISLTFSVNLLT